MFISYERMLFPIAGLILIMGIEPERISSALYILLYTVIASLPFLISGVIITIKTDSLFIPFILNNKIRTILYLRLRLTFLVKLPI